MGEQNLTEENDYMLIAECARDARCSEKTIRRLLEDGVLLGCKIRGGIRVLKSSWEQYKQDIIIEWQLDHGPAKYPGEFEVDEDK